MSDTGTDNGIFARPSSGSGMLSVKRLVNGFSEDSAESRSSLALTWNLQSFRRGRVDSAEEDEDAVSDPALDSNEEDKGVIRPTDIPCLCSCPELKSAAIGNARVESMGTSSRDDGIEWEWAHPGGVGKTESEPAQRMR